MNVLINREKHNKLQPYESYSKILIRDTRLNGLAKGIMMEVLSNDYIEFEFNIEFLKRKIGHSSREFYKSWKQLKTYKYVEQKYCGNHKWMYIFNEIGDKRIAEEKLNMKEKIALRKRREADYFSKFKKSRQNDPDTSEMGGYIGSPLVGANESPIHLLKGKTSLLLTEGPETKSSIRSLKKFIN